MIKFLQPLPATAARLILAIHRLIERTMKMSVERFPVGQEMDVTYPNFKVSLTLLSVTQLKFEIKGGPFARTET